MLGEVFLLFEVGREREAGNTAEAPFAHQLQPTLKLPWGSGPYRAVAFVSVGCQSATHKRLTQQTRVPTAWRLGIQHQGQQNHCTWLFLPVSLQGQGRERTLSSSYRVQSHHEGFR